MYEFIDKNGNISANSAKLVVIDKYGKVKEVSTGGGGSPTGPAGGDLSGTYPNPSVVWNNGTSTYNLLYYPLSSNPAGYITSAALTGYVPITRNLTINGTTYDLSADRTWSIPTFTSPLTTKGDIYVRNAAVDTRLPIGLDTQVLIADSTQSTGMKWGSNTAPTPTGYYGAWQDTTTQTAATPNVGYPMIFNTTDLSNGVSVVSNGTNLTRITFANTGIYNLQFSSQFQNSGNADADVTVWLRKGGVDVPGSAGFIQVPKRISAGAGNEGHLIVGWNYLLSVVGGEYYELIWSTTDSTYVTMQYYAAGNPPPSAASVILTVTQQSGIMAGTGITAINSLTGAVQTLITGTTGTDFGISSVGTTHTFNLPTASSTNRGALSSSDWTTFNNKQNDLWTFQRTQGVYFFEEFLGQNDNAGIGTSLGVTMSSSATTGASNSVTSTYPNRTNQLGVAQISTGTTSTGNGSIRFGSSNNPSIYLGSGVITYENYVNIGTLSTGTDRFIWGDGLVFNANYASAPQGSYFIYDEGGAYTGNPFGASPNFKAVTVTSGLVRTITNTNIAVSAGAWVKLKIEINSTASQFLFYINNSLVATHTTNLPTSPLFGSNWIIKTVGTTNVQTFKDYLAFRYIFTSTR